MTRAILSFVDRDMSDVVDRLGDLRAQIKHLEIEESDLKQQLIDAGVDRLATDDWSCTISRSTVATTDWRAIASRFEVSPQLLAAHTKHADRVTVRVTPII